MNVLRRGKGAIVDFIHERLGIRTSADLRNIVYVTSPYLVTLLVGWNIASEQNAKLIVALVGSVFSPALAFANTDDGFRRWVYGILMPLQSTLIGFGVATESQLTPLISVGVALMGGTLASSNTPVSTPQIKGRHAIADLGTET